MLIDIEILKEKLKVIKNNNYETTDRNYYEITKEMLNYIGSPDPELRDNLIYLILSDWIIEGVYTPEQLREILKIAFDDQHLFYKIGEVESDSVFTRSFSVLLIPPILITHRKKNILSNNELQDIYNKVIKYVREEKDLRGFIENKGWAHSVAHGADAIDELAMCHFFGHDELLELLELIKFKVIEEQYPYIDEEDERMVTAVVNIINRKEIDESEIIHWIESFKELEQSFRENNYLIFNAKNFLRSLYFRLLDHKEVLKIILTIKETLKSINRYKD